MEKIITLIIVTMLAFSSCNSSKKQDRVLLHEELKPKSSARYNGSFVGEVLNKQHRKNVAKITLSSDTNSYTFDNTDIQHTGTFSWTNESGNIIELTGLTDNYPNKFLVTPGAIIQMMNGNTLQDIDGNNQFVLALQ